MVAGEIGDRLVASDAGRRLIAAGVLGHGDGRLVVLRPLLTDEVTRAVLGLEAPAHVAATRGVGGTVWTARTPSSSAVLTSGPCRIHSSPSGGGETGSADDC